MGRLAPVCLLLVLFVALLSGAASAAGPWPWVTPLEIDFGPVGVGMDAPTQVVTITNTGAAPITNWAGGGLSAPFNVSHDCVITGGVPPGSRCHYFFDFKPTAPGLVSATSSSVTNLGPFDFVVHGEGKPAVVVAEETALDFGVRPLNSSTTQVITLRNAGLMPLTQWAGGGLSAPYNVSQDCVIPGGILPGGTCHYFFTFQPTAGGTFDATSSSIIQGVPSTSRSMAAPTEPASPSAST